MENTKYHLWTLREKRKDHDANRKQVARFADIQKRDKREIGLW